MQDTEFDKSKIYEKLNYVSEPEGYKSKVPWKVQQQISATNGIHYAESIGLLGEYPIPEIPIEKVNTSALMLDIGCGWGRWLTAAGKKNYIPIGCDLRLEFCETSRQVLTDHGLNGYTMVADLKDLPFKENIFDVVWSYSVIQHTHKDRLLNCITHIYRILRNGGYCCLEFPNKSGLRNSLGTVKNAEKFRDNYNSWHVRYYSIKEYKDIFKEKFKNFSFKNHSFLGIGVLPGDLKYIKGFKNKFGTALSLFLSKLCSVIPPMKYFSDSIYIKCSKQGPEPADVSVNAFMNLHKQDPANNLNIVSLIRCPISGGELILDESKKKLISKLANVYYPVINNIPVLVKAEAVKIKS